MEINRFKLENIKKEYYLPLAIIIGAIIIAISIYFVSNSNYKKALKVCEYQMLSDGSLKPKDLEKEFMKEFMLPTCALNLLKNK